MVKQLDFVAYRKLKNIQIDFSQHVNIIAGTNVRVNHQFFI